MKHLLVVALLIFSFKSQVGFAFLVPGDNEYRVLKTPQYRFVMQEDFEIHLPQILEFNQWINQKFEQQYGWTFDERAHLILLSERNQIANGFATVIPNLLTAFYPSGFLLQDEFASSSWFETLLIHETAHLYQLNVKPFFPEQAKKVVGNPIFVPIFVPIFIHPNIALPLILLEGNAVLQESSFQIGGRLHSGEAKAIAFAQILGEDLKSERLLNEHIDFPFTGKEKYILGGFFFQYLTDVYGADRVHLLFGELSKSFIVPLFINDAFLTSFGRSYNELFYDFVEHYRKKALGMKRSAAPDLFTALFFEPLNHDENSVFFHYQPDGRSMPEVVEIDRKTLEIKKTPQALLQGKVFKENDRWATTATFRHHPTLIEYGLYDEGAFLMEGTSSKIVLDQRNNQRVWAHPVESFFRGQLCLDSEPIGPSDSTAILSETGDVFRFLQEGAERILTKNGEEVARFAGFYSKPLEVTPAGHFYFISSTEKGSSLFMLADDQIYRLHPSDAIVDARWLSDDRALIVEISHQSYQYKIDRLSPIQEQPFFEPVQGELPPASWLAAPKTEASLPETNDSQQSPLGTYYSLPSLLFSAADITWGLSDEQETGGLLGSINLTFVDPLQWNTLQIGYDRSTFQRDTYFASYLNTRSRLQWGFGYLQSDQIVRLRSGPVIARGDERVAFGLLSYPLFIHGRWSSQWTTRFFWEQDTLNSDLIDRRLQDEAKVLTNSWRLRYSLAWPLSFRPYREFDFRLTHSIEDSERRWVKSDEIIRANWSLGGDLGRETFIRLRHDYARSQQDSIRLSAWERPLMIREDFFSLALDKEFRIDGLQTLDLELLKVLNHSIYFSRLPLSVRRWAPKIRARYFDIFNQGDNLPSQFMEYAIGSDIELVFAHRFPIQLGFDWFFFDDFKKPAEMAGWRMLLKSNF